MEDLLKVHNLKVNYPIKESFINLMKGKNNKYVHAVNDISFNIKKGEILSMVGESGSGKTTTGKAVLRLIDKNMIQGEILFNDRNILEANKNEIREYRRKAQMIFQDPYQSLNPKNTVYDIVAEPLKVNSMIKESTELNERVKAALVQSGLPATNYFLNRYPHELSGGQRQRVAIAGTIILEPDFIIADEPVSMLDVSIRADILRLMIEQRDKYNVSYIFITHDLSLAWVLSDRIAIMYLGKILEIGSGDEIIKNPCNPYSKALIDIMPKMGIKKKGKKLLIKGEIPSPIDLPKGCVFHMRCPYAKDICREEEPTLQEIFPEHFAACHLL